MQFSTIVTFALAGAALAVPCDKPKSTPKPTPTPAPAPAPSGPVCSNNQQPSCCNGSVTGSILGANCFAIPLLGNGQCSGNQVTACCQTNQFGLININLACFPITL